MKRFIKNEKKKKITIISFVLIMGIIVGIYLNKSHANFNTHKEFNIIQGKIPNKNGDIKLAVFVGGEKYKGEGFPSKENHKFKGYECTNGVELTWNPDTWRALIDTDKPTVCTLEFETKTEYEEEILKGSYPLIKDGLVPVKISDNGDVTKADIKDEWYSYANSRWANAIILVNNPSKTYNDGDPILEKDINAYFVWIPKYRYKLKSKNENNTTPSEFDIEFNSGNTTNSDTECIAPNTSGETGSCDKDKWMTHPAFTSLGENVTGIWVGKFETTGSTSVPTVKPNVSSLRSITGKEMYDTAWDFSRNLDSHMMKNTEWGAMAYLTNSKYGRGNSEVWINNYWNNNETLTGCTGSGVSVGQSTTCATPYFSNTAVKEGSTTRNMSGIFDTSGGAWEMVMGNLDNTTLSSGFPNNLGIASKYYDNYTGTDPSARILGDATQETYGWNEDFNNFVDSIRPWFIRGGDCSNTNLAGVFGFNHTIGGVDAYYTFRVVLYP